MKEPTKVKMGIAQTLDKLQALHGMVVAIFRSRSRHTYMRSHCISVGRPVGSYGVFRVASDRVIWAPKICAPRSLLLPSEPSFASLQGSLRTATGKEN